MINAFFIALIAGLLCAVILLGKEPAQLAAKMDAPVQSAGASVGCPPMYKGRPLTREVYNEADRKEPVLMCFYAPAEMMK